MTLQEMYTLAMKQANTANVGEFIFRFEAQYYFSRWSKNKWSEPKVITFIE